MLTIRHAVIGLCHPVYVYPTQPMDVALYAIGDLPPHYPVPAIRSQVCISNRYVFVWPQGHDWPTYYGVDWNNNDPDMIGLHYNV